MRREAKLELEVNLGGITVIKSTQDRRGKGETVKECRDGGTFPMGKILPVCYRCTQVPKGGLYDGFRVQGMFFCADCQQELFSAEQGSPEYQEFLFLIKGIFY